jgi:hypothetical protein
VAAALHRFGRLDQLVLDQPGEQIPLGEAQGDVVEAGKMLAQPLAQILVDE